MFCVVFIFQFFYFPLSTFIGGLSNPYKLAVLNANFQSTLVILIIHNYYFTLSVIIFRCYAAWYAPINSALSNHVFF